jgi:hypothetical protein
MVETDLATSPDDTDFDADAFNWLVDEIPPGEVIGAGACPGDLMLEMAGSSPAMTII